MPWIKYVAGYDQMYTSVHSSQMHHVGDYAKHQLKSSSHWFNVYTRRQHLPHEAPTTIVTIFDQKLGDTWHRDSPFTLVGTGDFDTAWDLFETHCRFARLGEE